MFKNRVFLMAVCTAACTVMGCNESVTYSEPCGGCPEGTVCNEQTNICELASVCVPACASNEICNTQTKLCEPVSQKDACDNACIAPKKCDEINKICVDCLSAADCTAQANGVCDNGTCSYSTGTCDETCVAPKKCDQAKNACVDCLSAADCTAQANGVCNDGTCSYSTDSCDETCVAPKKCDQTKNACVDCLSAADCTAQPNGQCTANGTCDYPSVTSNCKDGCSDGQVCDETEGKCVMFQNCGIEYNTCDEDADCESSVIGYEGLRICRGGYCINTKCKDLSWDPQLQRCGAMSGTVEYCGCNSSDECESPTPICLETTHECVSDCEYANIDNIIPNWSFEDWTGESPTGWTLENDHYQNGEVLKSSDAKVCNTSVKLINKVSDNARLESNPIPMPSVNYTASSEPSLQLNCSFYYKGTGHINLGYRALDAEGNSIKSETEARFNEDLSSSDWKFVEEVSKKINPPLEADSFQFLIGFHGTDNNGILIDGLECVMHEGICEGVECNEWEICSLTSNTGKGKCIPRKNFCSVSDDGATTGCNSSTQTCDTTTHTCKNVDGSCVSNKDCTDDNAPVCQNNSPTPNTCVAGDPCENAKCPEWKECTLASRGACVLKTDRCTTSADCPKEKPACYGETHTCVVPDFTYSVESAKKCPIAEDYFNYLNYVDEDPDKDKLHDTLVCPINIIPNGSFEDWVVFKFTEKSDEHIIPDWWYAIDSYNNFNVAANRYLTELSFDALKEYTTSTFNGESALQLNYTSTGGNNRLTSWGFKVPNGSWDCSYWVRGKGNVKVHTYSNGGDAEATDYVAYDTENWTRATFEIKPNTSDMRIIIYVSGTDASKDHIQVDNFVCTKKGSII